jgi:hypothetical protein
MTTIPSNPFFNTMHTCSLLFSFLSEKDQDNLALVNRVTNQVKIAYAMKGYEDLVKRISKHGQVIIKDADTVYKTAPFFNTMHTCSQLFSFLSEKDQDNLGLVNTVTNQVKIAYAMKGYEDLVKRISKHGQLIIKDADTVYETALGRVLGRGDSKQAIELDEQRVLLIPDKHSLSYNLNTTARYWKRMVEEEVGMARIFTQLGLLTPVDRRVLLLRSTISTVGSVPAFLSASFESLAKKGIFLISSKNCKDCTWKLNKDFLFCTTEERQLEKNWDPLFEPALKDVEKIFAYKLPAFDDAFNIAIVNNGEDRYEVRYFGFDFAGSSSLEIPNLSERAKQIDPIKVKRYLQEIVNSVFVWESGGYGEEYTSYATLRSTLVEKYTKIVMSRMI